MNKILLVDDDNYLRGLYAAVFKEAGFIVFEGKDGQEGLNLVNKVKPDVIFTGIMMPNLTGFELIRKLKGSLETGSIPVIVSSHLGRIEDRMQAEKLGAKAFVVKGTISPKQVVTLVHDILEAKVAQKKFRVVIDPDKLDGPALRQELKAKGPITLELAPGIDDGTEAGFWAKYLAEK